MEKYIPKTLLLQNAKILEEKRKKYEDLMTQEMLAFKNYESTRNTRLLFEKEWKELEKELKI